MTKLLKSPFRNEYSTHLEASRPCFGAHFRFLLRAAPRCPISECRTARCPDEFFLIFSRRVQIRRGPLQATFWHFANIPDHLYTRKRTKMNKISTVRGSNSAGHSVGATRQVKFSVSKIQRGVAVCEHFDTHPLKFKSSNQRHFCRVSHSHRYCIDFGDFRTL